MNGIGIDIGGTAVKVAAVGRAGEVLWTGKSAAYSGPSVDHLVAAIREAAGKAGGSGGRGVAAGVCVPGLLNDDRTAVVRSVNVPALNGVRLDKLLAEALGGTPSAMTVTTDTHATAYDLYRSRGPAGRMFMLAIGTGVGAAVLDEGKPLSVDGDSPGHFGQVDVSLPGEAVTGPDGGEGSLEGYLGASALAARYGPDPAAWVTAIRVDHPPMRALVRAVRIAHALFRPRHVFLAGGIGIRLAPLCGDLYGSIARRLTNIARPDWTLATGDSDFHAAQGAARLASTDLR